MYDEYDHPPHLPHLDSVDDSFLAHHNPPGQPSSSIIPTDLESRFQSNLPEHLNDYNNNSNLLSSVNDSGMHATSPLDGYPTRLPATQSMQAFQSQNPSDVNPIDRLLCMQNNYFRT